MRWTWVLVAVLGASRPAFAVDVVLTSQTSKAEIVMTDLPGDRSGDLVLVGWRDVEGAPAGTLIFQREIGPGRQHTTYRPIGGGPFAIIDAGERRLVGGTAMPVFEVDVGGRRTLELVAAPDPKRDPNALLAAYQAHESVAGPREGKAAIVAAIKATAVRVGKTCGGTFAADVRWAEFDKGGQGALAKQTIAVLEAAEELCGDADYKAAVAHLKSIRVGFRTKGPVELGQRGTTLSVTLSPTSFNPREVAHAWLSEHLEAP
jgi:hypothetical protein